jgi:hypothetical protein
VREAENSHYGRLVLPLLSAAAIPALQAGMSVLFISTPQGGKSELMNANV